MYVFASESRRLPLGAADDPRRVDPAVKVDLRLHLDCGRGGSDWLAPRGRFHFLPYHSMPGFSQLIKAVCGVSTRSTLADGTPIPSSLNGWQPVAVVQDRRLCAGVFMRSVRRRKATYRVIVWRTYRTAAGAEHAATTLFRDQVDPALALVAMLEKRMPPQ